VKKFPSKIAIFWIVAAVAAPNLVDGAESKRVDGVLIYGKRHDVSVAGIRQATKASTDQAQGEKPRAIQIINSREMRAYLPNPDLGYVKLRLLMTHELDGHEHLKWNVEDCCGIPEPPEALRIIRAADQAYMFPVKNSWKPHRDYKHKWLLDKHARSELVRLLSHKSDWEPGQYALFDVEPKPDVGFVFRHGENEVVLFFHGPVAEGTVNGRNIKDLLDAKRQPPFEQWKRRYVQPELSAR
jgi:hypothetical protein